MLSAAPSVSAPQAKIAFNDPANMKAFMEKRVQAMQLTQKERLEELKRKINSSINALYDEVCKTAFALDKYRIPIHGLPHPERENPMNLFQRQLKIEELSFELSQSKYKQSLDALIKIGRADQLSVSHRYIISWMKLLEDAISEQQKIFMQRGNLDPQKSKIGYYLIQMPSDKIASLCVLHLMKHLFRQFIHDIRNYEDEENLTNPQEVKIPAV